MKKFSDAMSELDTKYTDKALSYNSQATARHFNRRWTVVLVAAILALCLMGAGVVEVTPKVRQYFELKLFKPRKGPAVCVMQTASPLALL